MYKLTCHPPLYQGINNLWQDLRLTTPPPPFLETHQESLILYIIQLQCSVLWGFFHLYRVA